MTSAPRPASPPRKRRAKKTPKQTVGVKKKTVKKPPEVPRNTWPKPEKLYGEPPKAFHLRAIEWLVKEVPGSSYPEITFAMDDKFNERVASEVVARALKILEIRGWVTGLILEGQDKRRVNWYPVCEPEPVEPEHPINPFSSKKAAVE